MQQQKKIGQKLSSLERTTRLFMALIRSSHNCEVNLKWAASCLNIQKRRLYDITNALEGIGIISKTGKNHVRCNISFSNEPITASHQIDTSLDELAKYEEEIDEKIALAKQRSLAFSKMKYAYVRKDSLPGFPEDHILLVLESKSMMNCSHLPSQLSLKSTDPIDVSILDRDDCQTLSPPHTADYHFCLHEDESVSELFDC